MKNYLAAQPPIVPPKRSARLLNVVIGLYWLGMFVGTHVTTKRDVFHDDVSDKWLHFGAYTGLAVLLSAAAALRRPVSPWLLVRMVPLLALYGAFDELTQILVDRDCELFDWCADVAGALVGSGVVTGLALLRRRGRPSGRPPENGDHAARAAVNSD